jgi:P27 family predicted phage terminase small subunit
MAGRPHVPTALKVLNGTLNESRHNAREPQLEPRIPEAPAHLSEKERAAWAHFAQLLEPMRVVTTVDAPAMEMLVVTYVHHQRLADALRHDELVYDSERKDGGMMRRLAPEMTALADVSRRLLVLLGRFGLTPADRQKVVQSGEAGGNPYDEFR